ncbi:efflux RND transporter periplasmic adaptor subunit [Pseudomonadota bacterium]
MSLIDGKFRSMLAGCIFAVAALVLLNACDSPGEGQAVAAPSLRVLVANAEKRDVPLSIDMVGSTLGTKDVPIRTRVEGFLESMDFMEGTFVDEGDLLYTIDAQPFRAKLVEAQSQLAAAQTRLAKAEADLARIKPLAEIKAVSEQDLDGAVATEAATRASVRASEASVELAEIELSYTRIQAPISGLIGLTKAKPGEFVGRDPNPVVLNMVSDIDPIRARFSISEREYLILARNYMVENETKARAEAKRRAERPKNMTLILADGTEHPYKGKVVAASQSVDQETGTYIMEASFDNPRRYILPGQFARVRAPYETLKNVVVIPRKAISELQGLYRVYVVDAAGLVSVKEIKLGPKTGDDVVVESGLDVGETVIVEGIQKVRPGMTVVPVPAGAAEAAQG